MVNSQPTNRLTNKPTNQPPNHPTNRPKKVHHNHPISGINHELYITDRLYNQPLLGQSQTPLIPYTTTTSYTKPREDKFNALDKEPLNLHQYTNTITLQTSTHLETTLGKVTIVQLLKDHTYKSTHITTQYTHMYTYTITTT